jgi:hypothetical protein
MATPSKNAGTPVMHKPWYTHLYAQVLAAIAVSVLLGQFYPGLGEQMKPLDDAFIKLINILIAPIIFCTVVHGIASEVGGRPRRAAYARSPRWGDQSGDGRAGARVGRRGYRRDNRHPWRGPTRRAACRIVAASPARGGGASSING